MQESSDRSVPTEFLADESQFRCVVAPPDPAAARKVGRTQGTVTAYPQEPDGAPFAGRLFYFVDATRLETVRFCVQPEFRGEGCTTEMVKALRRAYPGFKLSSSPARPTKLGRDTLVGLHAKGLLDELRIDLSGKVGEPETGRCDER